MKRAVFTLVAVLSVSAAVGAAPAKTKKGKPLTLQNPARVAEIASYLSDVPSVFGAKAADRAAWGKIAAHEAGKNAVRSANARLEEQIPECPDALYLEFTTPGNGNRRNYEKPYFRRPSSMVVLATGECIENKGRFISKIVEYVDVLCSERTWTMPAHDRNLSAFNGKKHNVDLGAVHRAISLAWVYSVLGEKLPSETRVKIRSELDRRIFAPMRKCNVAEYSSQVAPMWWFQSYNNWTAVCHAGVVFSALSVLDDKMDRAAFIESAERSIPGFFSGFTDDGYCSEGLGYWNYGWGEFLVLTLAVREATFGKVDFCSSPKAKTIMRFGTGVLVSGTTAASIADGGGSLDAGVLQLGHLIWPDLPMTKNAAKRKPLVNGCTRYALLDFGQWDKVPSSPVVDYPVRTEFPIAQMYVMRPGKTDMPFRLSVKSGHNDEFHNHNDVGTYALFVGDLYLSGDPGGTIYTEKTFSSRRYEIKMLNSYGHPVPVLNGCLQSTGRKFEGKVVSTSFGDEKDVIVFDISGAYDKTASKISKLERTFVYDRAGGKVTVTDKIAFDGKGTVSVPVLTPGTMVSCDDGSCVLSVPKKGKKKGDCKVKVSVSVDGSQWKIEEDRIDNPGMLSPNRYAVTLAEPVESAEISLTYSLISK